MRVIEVIERLYKRIFGQKNPQPVYLEIDPGGETMQIRIWPDTSDAVPADVRVSIRLWYPLWIVPTIEAANKLLARVTPLATRIIAGHQVVTDGQGELGILDLDAEIAQEELEKEIDLFSTESKNWQSVWDEGKIYAYAQTRVTANTSDEEIGQIVGFVEQDADAEGAAIGFDVRNELERMRDDRIKQQDGERDQ